jgi:UDPglucose--hexose-1-phosphate uridylyltransferase
MDGRPWLGAVEKTETTKLPAYDPACYLCPGNTRATNGTVLSHSIIFVFFINLSLFS